MQSILTQRNWLNRLCGAAWRRTGGGAPRADWSERRACEILRWAYVKERYVWR